MCFKPNSLIYDSRNILSLTAIEQDFDNVLWLDSDILAPPDTLTRMQDYFRNGYDMISGLYFKRFMPTSPVIYSNVAPPRKDENERLTKQITDYLDYPENSFFPIAGCGFGCVLTSTRLLKSLWDQFGPPFHPFTWASEDISFCYRVNQSGAQIYADSSILCGHVGTITYTYQFYRREGESNAQNP